MDVLANIFNQHNTHTNEDNTYYAQFCDVMTLILNSNHEKLSKYDLCLFHSEDITIFKTLAKNIYCDYENKYKQIHGECRFNDYSHLPFLVYDLFCDINKFITINGFRIFVECNCNNNNGVCQHRVINPNGKTYYINKQNLKHAMEIYYGCYNLNKYKYLTDYETLDISEWGTIENYAFQMHLYG